MNVHVVVGNLEQYGVYTTPRRALARQEELERAGVSTVVSEVYLNEDQDNESTMHNV